MCGRYATARGRQELLDTFEIDFDAAEEALKPDYNVAPTMSVPVVMERVPKEEKEKGEKGEEAVRQLRMVRWGLVPSWAKNLSIGSKMINARVETVHEKPAYRRAFAKRRCLLPADGYFEWYVLEDAGSKPRKQPFFIRPRDEGVMAMAGLYEFWRSPEGEWVPTCTVITTQAPDDLGRIHERMPMIVEPDRWDAWLDPARTDLDDVRKLLVPAMSGTMEAYPVSPSVGNVRNNGPELIQPLLNGDISQDSET
jgi:putative SOS response-associated peptidase YedK